MNTAVPLRERVLSAAAATPSMTRRQGRRMAVLLIALSAAVAAALLAVVGGPADVGESVSTRGPIVRGWAIAAISLLCLVLGRGRSTVVRAPQLLTAATWASPVVILMWTLRFDGGGASLHEAVKGLGLGIAVAITPLASFLFIRRGAEPRYPGALGGAAGAMCGACAQVIVLLWHPFTGVGYAAVAHAVPLVALAGIGRVTGGWTLASASARARHDDTTNKISRNQDPVSTWSSWEDAES